MSEAVVTAHTVCKSYGKGKKCLEVLNGISFEASKAEVVAILGPSGAGKSTLLQLLSGIDRPNSGEIKVLGKSLRKLGDRAISRFRAKSIGLIFQMYHLLPDLSALENVMLPALFIREGKRIDIKRRASEVMDRLGVLQRSSHLPAELSGGEMQRVAIARALVNNPDILFCDEPTGNLDSANGEVIIQTLTKLAHIDKKTIIIATHDDRIAKAADRALHLKDGRWAV